VWGSLIEGEGSALAGEPGQRAGRHRHAAIQKECVTDGVKKTDLTLRLPKGEVQLNASLKQADLVEAGQGLGPALSELPLETDPG
jgi:hypothetical protein